MKQFRPGRDVRAVRHRAVPGADSAGAIGLSPTAIVVGGGIAGLSAALGLAERGVQVDLVEADQQFGGRAASWQTDDGRAMSRGFHAFFRQYYNLRSVLRRADPALQRLVPVPDYPLQRADGLRDSFAKLPRTPPWNLLGFVLASPSFRLRDLSRIDVATAFELIATEFPASYRDHDDESAAEFLDRLRFPDAARHLALEVFARSFFASPHEFSAGELVAMFHSYFTGSAEGLLFDVPDDHYDVALWAPLARHLQGLGVRCHTGAEASGLRVGNGSATASWGGTEHTADALVLAVDPAPARALVADLEPTSGHARDQDQQPARASLGTVRERQWREQIAARRNAPAFAVWRLWLDRRVDPARPAFLGTTGFGALDNVSVLERFEATAADWCRRHGGSVVELHAYAVGETDERALRAELRAALDRVFVECAGAGVVAEEWLVRQDCPLIEPGGWASRPSVATPFPELVMAGDWIRSDHPVALMERAATTGLSAANLLLGRWGLAGHDLWTVNPRGLLPRRTAKLPPGSDDRSTPWPRSLIR